MSTEKLFCIKAHAHAGLKFTQNKKARPCGQAFKHFRKKII